MERKFLRSSGSWVKPPVAKITALRALTRITPSSFWASTPMTSPLSLRITFCTRCPVLMVTPSRRHDVDSVRVATCPPSDMEGAPSLGKRTRPVAPMVSISAK